MNNFKTKIIIGLKNNLDKLLFIFATFYLMLIVGWFWKQQKTISSSSNVVNSHQESAGNYSQTLDIKNETSSPINNTNLPPLNIETNQLQTSLSSLSQPPVNSNVSTNTLNIPPLPIPQPPQPTLSPPPPISSNFVISTITPPPPLTTSKLTKVPIISTLNVNTENNNKNPQIAAIPQKTQIQTDYNYTLIGIVELGNSGSVALFNINNLTEKVFI